MFFNKSKNLADVDNLKYLIRLNQKTDDFVKLQGC